MGDQSGDHSEAESFALDFGLTEAELLACARVANHRWQRMFGSGWLTLLLSAPVALAGGATVVLVGTTTLSGGGFIVALLVAAYLTGAWVTYGTSLLSHRRYLATIYRSAELGQGRRIVIDDAGVRLTNGRSSATWSWAEVAGVGMAQGLLLLWPRSSPTALAIPERCIESATRRDALIRFVRKRVTAQPRVA
jgi:hypothetical protein